MTLTCTSGKMLSGPSSIICTGNGEWEPDPGDTVCVDTITQRSLEVLCRDGKIAVASSVTAFTNASILFFTVGFICADTSAGIQPKFLLRHRPLI